jgi:DMSO reductase anchor subunit
MAPGKERVKMTAHTDTAAPALSAAPATDFSKVSNEGIVAGLIGAATIAFWFLILDAIEGRPLYTPTVLGTALFGGASALEMPARLPVSFETAELALMFTWVHVLIFAALGGVAAYLLTLAERDPNYGFGILLFFVVFEFGFVVLAMIFAESVLAVSAIRRSPSQRRRWSSSSRIRLYQIGARGSPAHIRLADR